MRAFFFSGRQFALWIGRRSRPRRRLAAMPSRRGFAKLTTDDGADSDGTEIIEDDSGSASPGVDRGAFAEMFALAQSVGGPSRQKSLT